MFTVEQVKTAHSKVKSGVDFTSYVQELKNLGVLRYELFVWDSHAEYYGAGGYKASTPPKYNVFTIAKTVNEEQFKADLKAHQQGKTDYMTFCNDCAKSGIEKWEVSVEKLTCTYYDKAENEILVEKFGEK